MIEDSLKDNQDDPDLRRSSISYTMCYTENMSGFYSDTHPEIEALQIQLLRQTPPWRKLEMMTQLNISARQFACQGLRQRFPQADESELRRRLADLVLGEDLASKVYGIFEDAA